MRFVVSAVLVVAASCVTAPVESTGDVARNDHDSGRSPATSTRPADDRPRAEAVSFLGGPGELPMAIESCDRTNKGYVVLTTAARLTFDEGAQTLLFEQRIESQRAIARLHFARPLGTLEPVRLSRTEVVLAGDHMTFSIQCDGLCVITSQVRGAATVDGVGLLADSDWERDQGSLVLADELGGLRVVGSPGVIVPHLEGPIADRIIVGDGQRLSIYVTPCKPFDWEAFFDVQVAEIDQWGSTDAGPVAFATDYIFVRRGASNSKDRDSDTDALLRATEAGYKSNKRVALHIGDLDFDLEDPALVDEARRWRDSHGIDGVSVRWTRSDLSAAYENIRQLREIFSSGLIQLRVDAPSMDAVDRARSAARYAPIEAYADLVSVRTPVPTGGSQHAAREAAKRSLIFRTRPPFGTLTTEVYKRDYLPLLQRLRSVWEEHGHDPYFYEREYQPAARAITGVLAGRAGMPAIEARDGNGVTLVCRDPGALVRYEFGGAPVTPNSPVAAGPIPLGHDQILRARSFQDPLEPSRELTLP